MLFRRRSDKVDMLQTVPLFRNLSKHDLDQVARIADEVDSQPGEVLLRQGDRGREFILVAQGKVRIERNGQVIAHRGAGEFIGEMALLDGKPRSATVITEEPSTLLVVHWAQFGPLLDANPNIPKKLLVGLSERLREREEMLDT